MSHLGLGTRYESGKPPEAEFVALRVIAGGGWWGFVDMISGIAICFTNATMLPLGYELHGVLVLDVFIIRSLFLSLVTMNDGPTYFVKMPYTVGYMESVKGILVFGNKQ